MTFIHKYSALNLIITPTCPLKSIFRDKMLINLEADVLTLQNQCYQVILQSALALNKFNLSYSFHKIPQY